MERDQWSLSYCLPENVDHALKECPIFESKRHHDPRASIENNKYAEFLGDPKKRGHKLV